MADEKIHPVRAAELTRETQRARSNKPSLGHLDLACYPLQITVLAGQHAAASGATSFEIATPFDHGNERVREYLVRELEASGYAVTTRTFDRGTDEGLLLRISWPQPD